MASKKTIKDKLTQRHVYAIKKAERGDYFTLIQVCVEVRRAIKTVSWASHCNAKEWKEKTIAYYTELLEYLESFITDDATQALYLRTSQSIDGGI